MDYIKAYRIAVVKGCFIIKNSLKKYTKNYKQKKIGRWKGERE